MQPKCWCNIFNAWMCTETLFLFHGDNQTVWRTFTGIHGTSLMIQDWIISICAYVCVFHVYVILSACTCDLWVLCFVFYGLLSVLYLHILLLVPKWQIIVVFILFLLALNPNFVRKSQKEVKENGYQNIGTTHDSYLSVVHKQNSETFRSQKSLHLHL